MKGAVVCFCLAALIAGVCFWASSSALLSLTVLFLYLVSFLSLCLPKILDLRRKRRVRKDCYRFMNSYLTTCSVTTSLSKSFDVASEGAEGEMLEALRSVECNDVIARLNFLSSYFESPLYEIFLSIVEIYQTRGGDIISLSSGLLEEATKEEEIAEKRLHSSLSRLLQYGLLWGMSLGIVGFLRFALSTFYAELLASTTYLLSLACYFLFLLVSLVAYCFVYTEGSGKRGKNKQGKQGDNGNG